VCDLNNLIGAPLRANRCREMPRGRRVFVCGARSRFRTDYVQNALYKTLDPPPFLASSVISKRLGFGMRLVRISRTHPLGTRTRLRPAFTGVARALAVGGVVRSLGFFSRARAICGA